MVGELACENTCCLQTWSLRVPSPPLGPLQALIMALQAIIMQTPIHFVFKVDALDWKEWLACLAIGLGVIPYSWAVRIFVRACIACGCTGGMLMVTLRGRRVAPDHIAGRGSFRSASGRGSMRLSGNAKH